MPALTTIMVLSNVGLQLFNNWRSTNTNQALQKKQQEFQQASIEHNHERMMQLLREGQALQEQIEIENHETRIRNIGEDFDALIKRVFEQHALQKWPLTVLPMVMKNQSLGSYRTNNDENIALHVILTPSNCDKFNASVFQQIENGVEIFCNQHWNTLSSHPILFYGEAWKSGVAPTDNEIAQLQTALPHLPVLVVTPYFRPDNGKLVFNIHMWGIGNKQDLMIEPTKEEFSLYDKYVSNSTYDNDTIQTTIKEFVPYLQCMIGYLADVYFWSAHNQAPILPSLLAIGAVNTDGMKYLIDSSERNYTLLFDKVEQHTKLFQEDSLKLYFAISPLLSIDIEKKKDKVKDLIDSYCNRINISQNVVDCLWTCLWRNDVKIPSGFYLPTEIMPLLILLLQEKLLDDEKLSLLCSYISIYNPILTYNFSELMSVIESLYPRNSVRLRFVNANIVLCFVYNDMSHNMYSNCFGVLLYKSEHKNSGKEFLWDINNKKISQTNPSSNINKVISPCLVENIDHDTVKLYQSFCKSITELGEKILMNHKELITDIKVNNLTYKDILIWVKENYEIGESLIILVFAYEEYQYVIGLLTSDEHLDLKKYIGAKSFHIDSSIRKKMNNNSILIQKIK